MGSHSTTQDDDKCRERWEAREMVQQAEELMCRPDNLNFTLGSQSVRENQLLRAVL